MCDWEQDKKIRTCAKGNLMIRLQRNGAKIRAESTPSLNWQRVCFPGLRTQERYLRKDGKNGKADARQRGARQLNTADKYGNQQSCFLEPTQSVSLVVSVRNKSSQQRCSSHQEGTIKVLLILR